MNIWTTFCPGKAVWELTYIETKGKAPSSDWVKHINLIEESLAKLKKAGIYGIRLVIYPSEITIDGKNFNWEPIDTMLDKCRKEKLAVDLCIGPFQYPHYPGIFLPPKLTEFAFDNKRCLDTVPQLWKYGMQFLKEQIERYGTDKRIHGFHFANEWPDHQKVKGREKVRTCVSAAFMIEALSYLKKNTTKPIAMNTNIEASNKKKLTNAFGEIFNILGNQAMLGFDVYPSQFTWKKYPFRKLLYIFFPYQRQFKSVNRKFKECELYFAEVEAQPWGAGQSWYQLINEAEDPNRNILIYYNDSLQKTWNKYIKGTRCQNVSLWGSEFWLAAERMGIMWPLEQIKIFSPDKKQRNKFV